MAGECERVLVLAADLCLDRYPFGVGAHVAGLSRAPQAVDDGRVDELRVTQPIAEARLGQQVRALVHVLHTARHDHLGIAGADLGRGEHDRLESRSTDAVDGRRAQRVRQAGLQHRLSSRCLACPGLNHLAHQRFVDLVGRNTGTFHCGLDRDSAEGRRGYVGEPAPELADGRARRRDEEDLAVPSVCEGVHRTSLAVSPHGAATMPAVARLQRRRFDETEDVRVTGRGKVELVELGDRVIGCVVWKPGWRWSVDVKPVAGTQWCQSHHVGYSVGGRLRVQMDDGIELELGPGEVFEIPPGHDAWVLGDEPFITIDFEAMRGFARAQSESGRRTLASILFTDIVDSTAQAVAHGADAWSEAVRRHNEVAERVVVRNDGRVVKTTGDGVIALFDSSERAIRAAVATGDAVRSLGLRIRAAVHTGEVELSTGDVRGVAVHAAARMMALAGADDVVVSSTVHDVVDGTGLEFEDFGVHELKGLPGRRQIYRLRKAEPPE